MIKTTIKSPRHRHQQGTHPPSQCHHETSASTPINTFFNPITKQAETIHSNQILASIRWATDELTLERLGYTSSEVGCHSIRSGAAMVMYLKRVPTFAIMLQGRWCSDAFLQ